LFSSIVNRFNFDLSAIVIFSRDHTVALIEQILLNSIYYTNRQRDKRTDTRFLL